MYALKKFNFNKINEKRKEKGKRITKLQIQYLKKKY